MKLSEDSWSQRSRVTITIGYGDERIARAVVEAVSPDNIDAPEDIRVESLACEGRLFAVIEGKRSLERVLSTMEDLLSCVQAAERAIEALKGEKDKLLGPSTKSKSLERP